MYSEKLWLKQEFHVFKTKKQINNYQHSPIVERIHCEMFFSHIVQPRRLITYNLLRRSKKHETLYLSVVIKQNYRVSRKPPKKPDQVLLRHDAVAFDNKAVLLYQFPPRAAADPDMSADM